MSVPPRTPAPSAMDGYRRIVAAPVDVDAPADDAPRPAGVRRSRRIAGATRIAGLLAVIAVIAGTSIGLATADPKNTREERTSAAAAPTATDATRMGPPAPVAAVVQQRAAKPRAAEPAAAVTKQQVEKIPVVKQATAVAPIERTQATTPAPAPVATSAELPFTGATDLVLLRLVLAGALVTLLGMLVQIAGTPLPAHAMERKRLASRAT